MSFSSGMVTARSFAERNHYDIDVDRELIALGACQIASGLSHGFAVSGADSRTAVNDAMGGKTQMVGLIAAAMMTTVLFYLTEPLRYLPVAALGVVLIEAAIGLFDGAALYRMWRVSRAEYGLALFTTLASSGCPGWRPAGGGEHIAPVDQARLATAGFGVGPGAGDEGMARGDRPPGRHHPSRPGWSTDSARRSCSSMLGTSRDA
jgi:hypothetical protein